MAERRMFSKTIIDSDIFIDMPLSAQSLYFHLSMRADDDGFINNPKKIQRMIGASDDDLKILMAKQFLIPFESGIVVIKHWKIHNYIQKDRYKETIYTDEKAQLETRKNKEYQLPEPGSECIQDVSKMDTQVRLGKVRLGKVRLGEVREGEVRRGKNAETIAKMYNEICKSYPKVRSISEARERAIKARMKRYNLDDFRMLFEKAEASNFLKGGNDKDWSANFDWLIKDRNMAKVLDGNFDNKSPKNYEEKTKNELEMQKSYNMMAEWANTEDA